MASRISTTSGLLLGNDVGDAFVVIPSKVFRSRFAAKVAINAGAVHVKLAGDV